MISQRCHSASPLLWLADTTAEATAEVKDEAGCCMSPRIFVLYQMLLQLCMQIRFFSAAETKSFPLKLALYEGHVMIL